jgi:hypothetical protein
MKTKTDTPELIAKHVRSLDLGKRNYKKADAALEAILATMKAGDVVTAANGRKYELVDEFAVKMTVFKPCGVRRYRLEEITEP